MLTWTCVNDFVMVRGDFYATLIFCERSSHRRSSRGFFQGYLAASLPAYSCLLAQYNSKMLPGIILSRNLDDSPW
jgi:hypothetical protein